MISIRHWMESIEQAAIDDYGYRPDEAVKFAGDVFGDKAESDFESGEPHFTEFQ